MRDASKQSLVWSLNNLLSARPRQKSVRKLPKSSATLFYSLIYTNISSNNYKSYIGIRERRRSAPAAVLVLPPAPGLVFFPAPQASACNISPSLLPCVQVRY